MILKPLIIGLVVGAIFGGFNLPIPAPSTLGGILGLAGLILGYLIIQKVVFG